MKLTKKSESGRLKWVADLSEFFRLKNPQQKIANPKFWRLRRSIFACFQPKNFRRPAAGRLNWVADLSEFSWRSKTSGVADLRVGGRNWPAKSCKMWKNLPKKLHFFYFVTLNSSHDFLSVIFGFLSKFGIDIGKNIFSKLFFWNEKQSRKKLKFSFWWFLRKFPTLALINTKIYVS